MAYQWTIKAERRLREGWMQGDTAVEIGADIGASRDVVYRKAKQLGLTKARLKAIIEDPDSKSNKKPPPERPSQRAVRKCLGPDCGKEFMSDGPHNRICGACKDTKTYRGTVSPYADAV